MAPLPHSQPHKKHSNQWLENAVLIFHCNGKHLTGNRCLLQKTFFGGHCDNTTFPCTLIHCWLCSCFPLRSGALDDGRPRYGFCSFSTLLSLFLYFILVYFLFSSVAASKSIKANDGQMLASFLGLQISTWLQSHYYFSFCCCRVYIYIYLYT